MVDDYSDFYEFLDNWDAKECGNDVATFVYEFESDVFGSLSDELEAAVELAKGSRIYAVTKAERGQLKGRFLKGGRRGKPWAGYGSTYTQEDVDVDD